MSRAHARVSLFNQGLTSITLMKSRPERYLYIKAVSDGRIAWLDHLAEIRKVEEL